jgi:hypothetical protein
MTTMSVPSTLVKCLYLFFDLPHVPEAGGGAQNELPLAERRGLLQKAFVQVRGLLVCTLVSGAVFKMSQSMAQLVCFALFCVLIRFSLHRLG